MSALVSCILQSLHKGVPAWDCLSRSGRLCNNPLRQRIMEQAVKAFAPDRAEAPRWIGRIVIAVLLGEAIWGLIVSVMNNLIVPWLGDVMGQSSGLPTSFTQRPYNYPDLFVSIFEACIAGLVAAVLNYVLQRPTRGTVSTVKSSIPSSRVEPVRTFPQPATTAALTQTPSPFVPPGPVVKAEAVVPQAPMPAQSPVVDSPAPLAAPTPAGEPAISSPAVVVAESAAAKPLPQPPKATPSKPKKPKEVYYNIVGEPMPSDED